MLMIERIKYRWKELLELEKSSINVHGVVLSFREVEKLLALYDAVEAAGPRVWPHETREKDYCIPVEAWDAIEAAFKVLKEAE